MSLFNKKGNQMKYKLLFLIIFTFSCNSQPIREEINVGETIKIQATNFNHNGLNCTYKWTKPDGPNNHNSHYKIENDKMLFTPKAVGDYDIILLIESQDRTLLYEESFIFHAIATNEYKSTIKPSSQSKKILIEEPVVKENKIEPKKEKFSYTIQIASWPTKERAIIHQQELQNLGYDSYIEEFNIKKKNQTWWRVRVGHFIDKQKAEIIKKELSNILKTELWIDYINN